MKALPFRDVLRLGERGIQSAGRGVQETEQAQETQQEGNQGRQQGHRVCLAQTVLGEFRTDRVLIYIEGLSRDRSDCEGIRVAP